MKICNGANVATLLFKARPFIHPFDGSMMRATRVMALFLPTRLTHAEHDKYGAKLWIDEAWHWYTLSDNNNGFWEIMLLHLFSRLFSISIFSSSKHFSKASVQMKA